MFTHTIIIKGVFVKAHFTFRIELSAVQVCIHFLGHPVDKQSSDSK